MSDAPPRPLGGPVRDGPDDGGHLRRARHRVLATFAFHGLVDALWLVRIPALTDKLHLHPGQVGAVGLCWGAGALLAMQVVARILPAYGSRRVLWVSGPAMAVGLGAFGLAPTYRLLLAIGIAFGAAAGALDVAMNAQAATIERITGRAVMSGMHAAWSVGSVSGGALGALAASAGWGFTRSLTVAAAVALPLSLALAPGYLRDAPDRTGPRGRRVRMPAVVYLAGAIVFMSFLVEGTSATWSGLYLRDGLHTREAVAALAYPLLQIAMIAGRLAGDPLRARVGTRRVLIAAGLGVAASFALVTATSWGWLAIAGFVAAGLAIAPVVPLGFSVAGAADPTGSGTGIARAAGMAYTGTLAGPVAVGYLAELTSLRGALLLAVVLGVGICLLGRALPAHREAESVGPRD